MAMRTASPWWASLIFGFGVATIFFGERLFGHLPGGRTILTVIGVLAVLGITGMRVFTTLRTNGARRGVERTLLICQLGVIFGLVLYALTTTWGVHLFSMTEKG